MIWLKSGLGIVLASLALMGSASALPVAQGSVTYELNWTATDLNTADALPASVTVTQAKVPVVWGSVVYYEENFAVKTTVTRLGISPMNQEEIGGSLPTKSAARSGQSDGIVVSMGASTGTVSSAKGSVSATASALPTDFNNESSATARLAYEVVLGPYTSATFTLTEVMQGGVDGVGDATNRPVGAVDSSVSLYSGTARADGAYVLGTPVTKTAKVSANPWVAGKDSASTWDKQVLTKSLSNNTATAKKFVIYSTATVSVSMAPKDAF